MIKYDKASFTLGLGGEVEKEREECLDDLLLLRFRTAIKKHAESLQMSNDEEEEPKVRRVDADKSHAEAQFIEIEAPIRAAMNNIKVNDAVVEEPPPSGKIVPYWMQQCQSINSPLLRLHQEIVSLVELLQPTEEEAHDRMSLVSQIEEVAKSLWPHSTVTVFGSYATGLYVPTSDVDLVVLNTEVDVLTGLRALANALTRRGVAKGMQVIAKAKVPIIKFEAAESGLNVDISFDVPNGPQAAELVKEVIGVWPMLRPLVLVIKLFLQQRELNEVYSGGIGSYALIVMLIAFLQLHTSRRRGASEAAEDRRDKRGRGSTRVPASPLEPSLGVLLIDFFRLYGRMIDMKNVGVSATGGGHYYSKEEREGGSWMQEGCEYMLSVEDPKDASNDISRNSFNVARVKSAFDFGYQQLAAPSLPQESLLARILRLGPILSSRRRPINPLVCYKPPGPSSDPIKSKDPKKSKAADGDDQRKGVEGDKGKKRQRDELDAPAAAKTGQEKDTNGRGGKKRARSPSPAADDDSDAEGTRQIKGRPSSDDENEVEDGEDCDLQDLRRNANDRKSSKTSKRGRNEKDTKHLRWE